MSADLPRPMAESLERIATVLEMLVEDTKPRGPTWDVHSDLERKHDALFRAAQGVVRTHNNPGNLLKACRELAGVLREQGWDGPRACPPDQNMELVPTLCAKCGRPIDQRGGAGWRHSNVNHARTCPGAATPELKPEPQDQDVEAGRPPSWWPIVQAATQLVADLEELVGPEPTPEVIARLLVRDYPVRLDATLMAGLIQQLRAAGIPGWWMR